MKRTIFIVGIAAALAVPSAAAAGNVTAQARPQVSAQVVKTQVVNAQITAARVTAQRATGYRISLLRRAR